MKFLYVAIAYSLGLVLVPALLVRSLLGEKEQLERLGLRLPAIDRERRWLWFIASSVGEVKVAGKLINAIRDKEEVGVLLSVTTKAGRQQAARSCGDAALIVYHPFDLLPVVTRFLKRVRPHKIVLVETEIWPVLLERGLRNGVGVDMAAGRISERSFSHYRAFRRLFAPLVGRFDQLLMQSEADADRIAKLGARPDRVTVVGTPKSEYVSPSDDALQVAAELLAEWDDCLILTCGSTRPGEEEIILQAFSNLKKMYQKLRLVLAPRHLKRIDDVVGCLDRSGCSYVRRSRQKPEYTTEILLLDAIGELNAIYHKSDVAFVGGTLAPIGGHNLLEPALAGCPVLYGPHTYDQQPAVELLEKHELGTVVRNGREVADVVNHLLVGGSPRDRFQSRVVELKAENSGIIDVYADRILGRSSECKE